MTAVKLGNRNLRRMMMKLARQGEYPMLITGNKATGFRLAAKRGNNAIAFSRTFNREDELRNYALTQYGVRPKKLAYAKTV